jgi:ketosteroid isomerase-like protein
MIESGALREIVRGIYSAVETGDAEWFASTVALSEQTLVIGSAPEEWWEGGPRVIEGLSAHLPEIRGVKLTATRLRAFESGDFGYATDRMQAILSDGSVAFFRFTAVFTRESGQWRLLHQHGSKE